MNSTIKRNQPQTKVISLFYTSPNKTLKNLQIFVHTIPQRKWQRFYNVQWEYFQEAFCETFLMKNLIFQPAIITIAMLKQKSF